MPTLEIVLLFVVLVLSFAFSIFTWRLWKRYKILIHEQSKTNNLYVTDQLSMTIVCNSQYKILDIINPKDTILLKVPVTDLIDFDANKLEQVVWRKYRQQARMLIKSLKHSLETKENYYSEYVLTLDSGKKFYVFFLFEYVDDSRVCCHITTLDAFSLYRERELLKETNLNLKLALDTSEASVWSYDVLKDCFSSLVGAIIAHEGATFKDCYDMLHPDSKASYNRIFKDLISGKTDRETYTYHFIDPLTGCDKYYHSEMASQKSIDNKTNRIIGTQRDVTSNVLLTKKYEDLYRQQEAILSLLPVGVEIYDREGTLTYHNLIGQRLIGSDNLANSINLFENPNLSSAITEALYRGEDVDIQMQYCFDRVRDSGYHDTSITGKRYIDMKATVIKDANMRILNYAIVFQDITQNVLNTEQLVQMNRQNKMILDNTHSGFIFFTLDYKIQWENVSSVFKGHSLANKYRTGLICYRDIKGFDSPCRGCLLNEVIEGRQIIRREICVDDCSFLELIATPVFNDNDQAMEGVVMRVDNITERKLINIELNEAKEKAEQSNQLKSAFLANMSHEIRTPLNAIVGFSDIAFTAETEEERNEYRHIISTNSELLINLINDILDLSKIEAGYMEMNLGAVDFAWLFDEIYTTFALRMKPNVALNSISPYSVCVVQPIDKQRIMQVISNFISNAIKFTPKGSITIGYECADNGLRFYVQDTGVGIEEENKNKVFHRFQKFDSFAQGTGLGLSICKALIEAMKGKIGFESKEGEGTIFWAWIPCQVEVSEHQEEHSILNNHDNITSKVSFMDKIKILVAEDNNSNFLLLRAILKEYNLTRANNGLEAVELAKNELFDLILMDIKMPEMSGLEATVEIRKFNATIPIIALTANAFDSDKEEAIKAGCSDFLTKPLNKELLFRTIQNL